MSAGSPPILAVRDLEKTFGLLVAARDITVSVPAEQTVGVIGANGAGKTTFINMVTGHLTPTTRSAASTRTSASRSWRGCSPAAGRASSMRSRPRAS